MAGASLLVVFLVGLPPYSDTSSLPLGFLSSALLLFAAVAFGVSPGFGRAGPRSSRRSG